MKRHGRNLAAGALLAGGILALLGLYYSVVKAGIPYQDAPQELYIQWRAWHEMGSLCLKWGAGLLAAGVLLRVLSRKEPPR